MKYMLAVKPGQEEKYGYLSECGLYSIKRTRGVSYWEWVLRSYPGESIDRDWNRTDLAERNGFIIRSKK